MYHLVVAIKLITLKFMFIRKIVQKTFTSDVLCHINNSYIILTVKTARMASAISRCKFGQKDVVDLADCVSFLVHSKHFISYRTVAVFSPSGNIQCMSP